MNRWWGIGVLALALWVGAPEAARAQVLERASSSVRGSGGGQSAEPSRSSGGGSSGGSSGSGGSFESDGDGDANARGGVPCPPDQSYIRCLRERWTKAGLGDVGGLFFFWGTVLGEYPYAEGSGGYAVPALGRWGRERGERTAFRLEAETGYVIAGAWRVAAAARVQLPFFLDLAARYTLFLEPGDVEVSTFVVGRVDLELRLLDTNGMQLRIGGGLRHAHDPLGSVFGGGMGLAMDIFPFQPVILSLSADVGVVGEAVLASARASLGLIVDATEIYVGYHYEGLLGTVDVDLGAVLLGVRAWL